MRKTKKLQSNFSYDRSQAIALCKIDYYKAQAKNMKMYNFMEEEKLRLSTPKWEIITELLEKYKSLGEDGWESSMGKTLLGLYNKNKEAALNNTPVKNTNVLSIIAKPETLLIAYRAIKGNKGAMTKGATMSSEQFKQLNSNQKIAYFKSNIFPDEFSLQDVYVVSKLLRKGLYPWGSSSRVYVPKPGVKDKKRPITIPPFLDRIIQKAITLILEAIYEPEFEKLNRSFGFRSNKGVHNAIVAITSSYNTGMKTALEGDIEAAYDTVDKDKLTKILSNKITDQQFLKLIRERLDYDFVEQTGNGKIRIRPPKGIPQGGIDSPYLFNIYMHELDKFIHKDVQGYIDTKNQRLKTASKTNKIYSKVRGSQRTQLRRIGLIKLKLQPYRNLDQPEMVDLLRKELFETIKNHRLLAHRKNHMVRSNSTNKQLRIFYVRYADDWILLTNGSKETAEKIKEMISCFLQEELSLALSKNKTLITDIRTNPARFLGFEIKCNTGYLYRRPNPKTNVYKKWLLMRKNVSLTWASPDRQRMIDRFHMKGFCDKQGNPTSLPWLSCLEAHTIIERYNAIIRGLAYFYIGYIRNDARLHRWIYILIYSCLKTLAQKYRSTIPKLFNRFGHNLYGKSDQTIRIKVQLKVKEDTMEKFWTLLTYKQVVKEVKKINLRTEMRNNFWEIEKNQKIGEYPLKDGKIPTITNDDYLNAISWVSLRTQASLDMPCASCGTFDKVHQHHIKHIRKRSYTLIPEAESYKQIMALRNRKQIPLCSDCHPKLVHPGKYTGPPLIKLAPTRQNLVDNRVIHVESFVKPGAEYHSKPLEERGWKKVGKYIKKESSN
jgi:retron-type reverse transcriptase